MPWPRLVAFDLDDTLAPSKSPLDSRMADLLLELAARVEVAVISGGTIAQFQRQILDAWGTPPADSLSHLHLLPACGTQYFRVMPTGPEVVYARSLTAEQKLRARIVLQSEARRLGLWEGRTWGEIIEDRGSQVTFSALGQSAPVEAKAAWDPSGGKRRALQEAVAPQLSDLEVRAGGSTSLDITERGVDKAFGMSQLSEHTGIPFAEMVFIGDRLEPGGNDYPVISLGVPCHAVRRWEDTAEYVSRLLREPGNGSPIDT